MKSNNLKIYCITHKYFSFLKKMNLQIIVGGAYYKIEAKRTRKINLGNYPLKIRKTINSQGLASCACIGINLIHNAPVESFLQYELNLPIHYEEITNDFYNNFVTICVTLNIGF